jgi:hypothetical protein
MRKPKEFTKIGPDRGGEQHPISRLSPLGGHPVDLWITPRVAHNPTGHHNSSGHLMCYENRTSSKAIDSLGGIAPQLGCTFR